MPSDRILGCFPCWLQGSLGVIQEADEEEEGAAADEGESAPAAKPKAARSARCALAVVSTVRQHRSAPMPCKAAQCAAPVCVHASQL